MDWGERFRCLRYFHTPMAHTKYYAIPWVHIAIGYFHTPMAHTKHEVLPWVHIAIGYFHTPMVRTKHLNRA